MLTSENNPLPVPDVLWFSCDGMMVIDENRRILAMNPALEKLLGRRAGEAVEKSECGALFSCRNLQGCPMADQPSACPGLKAMKEFKPVTSAEYSIRSASGKGRVVSTSYTPIQLPDRPVWALAVIRDITQKKKEELHLVQKTLTDPLTGLANRTALLEGANLEIRRASRHHHPFSLAMVDIDGFKACNDRIGHPAGDDMLRSLAALLRAGRRVSDLIGRYGGDEFALLLPETDAAGAIGVLERLCEAVRRFPFPRLPKPVSISVGVAVFPGDGESMEQLLSAADRRLYEAKRAGCGRVVGPEPS